MNKLTTSNVARYFVSRIEFYASIIVVTGLHFLDSLSLSPLWNFKRIFILFVGVVVSVDLLICLRIFFKIGDSAVIENKILNAEKAQSSLRGTLAGLLGSVLLGLLIVSDKKYFDSGVIIGSLLVTFFSVRLFVYSLSRKG